MLHLHYTAKCKRGQLFSSLAAFQKSALVFPEHERPKKNRQISIEICRFFLVEAGGVEPPSENTSSGTSPGADGSLHSLAMTQAVMLHGSVASFVMPGAKLTPVTCTTQVTPKPSSWSFWGGRPLLSSGENSSIVVL